MTLLLARSGRDAMVEHAREGAPREVCGVLGGTRGTHGVHGADGGDGGGGGDNEDGGYDTSHVRTVERVPNVAANPRTRYELDPTEQFRAMEVVEEAGEGVVGFYHSHPRGPPRPSATDEDLATWPGYSYVIVSLGGPEPAVRSWRWTGEAFEREAVAVVDDR